MNVLVTGGAGYIGSQTAKQLSLGGESPIVLDNLSTGFRPLARWGHLIEGDLADAELLRHVLAEYEISAVIHFAASAYVGESMTQPRIYFRNNVVNTMNLLDAMVEAGVPHLVFSSSCATYGHPETVPITESTPQNPINPYGESKLFVERMLHWYGEAYGVSSVSLRYFNAAGADLDGETGELHDPETHLIPLTIQAALGERDVIDIYGTDYPTPDGTAVRDFVHVVDLADAHIAALAYLRQGGPAVALNLGAGQGHSVSAVIRTVEQVHGTRVPARLRGRRAGDPPVLVADVGRANEVLGWAPRYSDLETIINTALRWHANHKATGEPVRAN